MKERHMAVRMRAFVSLSYSNYQKEKVLFH